MSRRQGRQPRYTSVDAGNTTHGVILDLTVSAAATRCVSSRWPCMDCYAAKMLCVQTKTTARCTIAEKRETIDQTRGTRQLKNSLFCAATRDHSSSVSPTIKTSFSTSTGSSVERPNQGASNVIQRKVGKVVVVTCSMDFPARAF